MNSTSVTSKGEQAKKPAYRRRHRAIRRIWPPCDDPRYRRAGRAEYRRYHLLFRFERRPVSRLRTVDRRLYRREFPPACRGGRSPARPDETLTKPALRELILRSCRDMSLLLTRDDTVNLSKFISREQLSPTAAYQLIHQQVIAPLHSYLTRLIAARTGRDANDTQMILHTHAPAWRGAGLPARAGNHFYCVPAGRSSINKRLNRFFSGDHLSYRFHSARVSAKEHGIMKKPVVVLLVVIVLAALGGGWWWYQKQPGKKISLSTAMSIFAL